MTLSQQRVIELKLDAALSKVASGTGGVTVDSGANYNLTSTFKPPTPVCITVEQFDVIVPPAAPGGGSVPAPIIANFAPVTPGLAIRTVIHGK